MPHYVQHFGDMGYRMKQSVVRRPSLPLTAEDEADLALLRDSASHRHALVQLTQLDLHDAEQVRESVLLHAVFEAGLAAIRHVAEAEGYQQLAAEYEQSDAERRRLSRRRPPAWADQT